uniref:Uncharacterized protein n=1 Tax=Mycena chlorophos TaxID=658473 RepID=A0ABQ0L214_MYCCL|nr:predicted protein [Mycena chlorophos]
MVFAGSSSQSQVLSTLVLSALSLIPHPVVRIAAAVLCAVLAVAHIFIAQRPPTLLVELKAKIEEIEDAIAVARETVTAGNPWLLMEESSALLRIKRSASILRCSLIHRRNVSLMGYIRTWFAISRETRAAQKLLSRVQLVIEADLQRSYSVGIDAHAASHTCHSATCMPAV